MTEHVKASWRLTDPVKIGHLTLPNRLIKAATYEGMTPNGRCTEALASFHVDMAKGSVGLTTVAYASVHPDGRTNEEQLLIDQANVPSLKSLTDSIHEASGLVSIQLTHCGYFTRNKKLSTRSPGSASRAFNSYGALMGLPFSHAMTGQEMDQVVDAFMVASERAITAGFDAIELHMGHGYLLSQFLSPAINRRSDEFGGNTANRFRFPGMVLDAVKSVTNGNVPVIIKMNVADGFKGGLDIDEAVEVALMMEDRGADAIVTSGGFTSRSPFYLMRGDVPWKGMINVEKNYIQKAAIALFGPFVMKQHSFSENYFLDKACQIPDKVSIPVFYSGGVVSTEGMQQVIKSGFAGVAVGRGLIHDPSLIHKLQLRNYTSPCNHCNRCMVEMDKNGVKCVIV